MAKGQLRGSKEAKKPKADKNQPKKPPSAYQQSKGASSSAPAGKKS